MLAFCLALLVYGSALANQMVYYHSHITSDGRSISHAHPFNKSEDTSPNKSHHHSTLDLLLLFGDGFHHFSFLCEDFTAEESRVSVHGFFLKEIDFQFLWSMDQERGPPNCLAA